MTDETDDSNEFPDLVLDIEDSDDDQNLLSSSGTSIANENSIRNSQECQSFTPSTSKQSCKLPVDDELNLLKIESRPTPRRTQLSDIKGGFKQKQSDKQPILKTCEQHTFLTDITEVRQMEEGLLKLLEDFHSGKLQAFGKNCTFEKMEQIREQQERLARLHFELNAQQEIYGSQSEDGQHIGRENLGKLIENLQQLSSSIEQLQISSSSVQTDV